MTHINHLDPLIKSAQNRAHDDPAANKIHFTRSDPRSLNDPVDAAKKYVLHQWVQQLVPVRTECVICHTQSDMIYLPIGTMCFGDLGMLRRGNSNHKDRDITTEAINEFAKIGWKFQLKRSYCPGCKGLGSV